MFHAKTSSAHTMDGVLKKTSSAHRRSVTVACSSAYPLRPELENAQLANASSYRRLWRVHPVYRAHSLRSAAEIRTDPL